MFFGHQKLKSIAWPTIKDHQQGHDTNSLISAWKLQEIVVIYFSFSSFTKHNKGRSLGSCKEAFIRNFLSY
jgi:hypothetical protein